MYYFNCTVVFSIIFLPLCSKWILASAFHVSPLRLDIFSLEFSHKYIFRLGSTSNDGYEDLAVKQTSLNNEYSIRLADSRESILGIKLYRFGGPTVEKYMEANPEIASRDDALLSLTRGSDDSGKTKVYYGNGGIGESVTFFALADDVSSFVSQEEHDKEDRQDTLLENRLIVGSIEAVIEPMEDEEGETKVLIELKNLSVHTNARRRGIGKALTKAVQEFARSQVLILEEQQGKKIKGLVHLLVERENEGAMRLYEENGFIGGTDPKDQICKLTWSITKS
uniref:N-acetyltransferase domain-containing protein n=1 Tax=Pseudo-nitzschia australis TaxID=44445 RepID=A0A7S4ER62_9STRA|mmetsp:Transcript_983/g.2260  ORF Transcript_983/g.2260 Transcript_983/m.2260 type:complete len:281 (-) Transcript_983:252-1094(-)